jgi:uncharacterized PurR-regulated membrane protein YhhQ (DUF165 family)
MSNSRAVGGVIAGAAFLGCVVAANWMTATFGLVPIGFGLLVTAGTFAAGLSLIARDWVQQAAPRRWAVPVLIVAGALLSAGVAPAAIALASGVAFLASEVVDWSVFTPLRERSLPLAVVVSSLVAAPVDTLLFLQLAGFPVTVQAVAGQVLVKTGLALVVAALLKVRAR